MPRALWNNKVIAESDSYKTVEENVYFPPQSLKREFFRDSTTYTTCSWKGVASYYSVVVDGQENHDAAWYYPQPLAAASNIADHVAFWRGVMVEK